MIRRSDEPFSVNERLVNAAIEHAVYLERLKAGEVERIVKLLNREVIPDLLARVQSMLERIRLRGIDGAALGTQRYRDMISALDEIVRVGMKRLGDENAASLFDVARHESAWQVRTFEAAVPREIALEFELPDAGLLRSIVTSRPMQGHLLKDWWSELGRSTKRKVQAELNIGLTLGEDVDAIVRRLRGTREARYTDGILQQSRRSVQSIVRTSVSHVTSHAARETFKANDDLVKGMRLAATLDLRTCFAAGTPVHLANGTIRSIEDVQPGDIVVSGCGLERRVRAVQRKRASDWRTIRTDDGSVVRCTATHPFWADVGGGRFEWVEARDLLPGALLAHGDVLPLRGPLQEEGLAPAELLLARVLPRGDEEDLGRSGVHAVLPAVPCAEDLRSAGRERRAALLAGVLRGCASQRLAGGSDHVPLRDVRADVHAEARTRSERQVVAALLDGVPPAACHSHVSELLDAVHLPRLVEADLLLVGVLPDIQCGDSAGAHGAGGARARGPALRAGSADRPLVAGLPRRGHARDRSGRLLLARGSSRPDGGEGAIDPRRGLGALARNGSASERRGARCAAQEPAHDVVPRPAGAVRIVSINHDCEPGDCFDIEVSGDHCYLVGAGRLIAHNTAICRERDGKVYRIDEAPPLPFHWGERSVYVAVMKSLKELGLPFKDLAPSTRASMDGQVPETLTYYDWLAKQSAERQDAVLGPARGAIFRRGKLSPSRFLDELGRPLTLAQLAALESRAA